MTMKRLYLFSIALLFHTFLQAQDPFWKVYPSTYEQSAKDVIATADGGYLLVGETRTQYAGDSDVYIVKTNNKGEIQWTKTYGGVLPDYPNNIVASADGNYMIVGFTESYGAGHMDVWLLKIDPSGNLLWQKTYGTPGDDEGKEIISTSDGNYMIVGHTNYSWGNTNEDAFLKKIDPSGNELWTKYYGGTLYETGHSVKQCTDGGYIFTGQTTSTGPAGDTYLVRTDVNGNQVWAHTYGGSNNEEGKFILANSDGTFTISAETNSNASADSNVQIMKLDANGGVIWNKIYGGTDKDVAKTIRPTSDGGYIEAAISRSFGWINPEMWLLRLNANGDTLWTRRYGSWDHDHCYAAKQTSDGGFIAVGHQEDPNGIEHIQFVKTNSNGTLDPVGINELASNASFKIYPNPSNGLFSISASSQISSVNISDALGNLVKVIKADDALLHIDIADKPKGAYLVTVRTATSAYTRKIILR
jgi:hypothetical protein